jgi:threonine aldolase
LEIIDLRSDTVTLPTEEMRQAMSGALVGDDVMEEDPTVKQLESMAAEKIGKESALFVPSGTMANLASVLTHCHPREECILGDKSHIFLNEAGGMAAFGGVQPHVLANQPDGTIDLYDIRNAIRGDNVHWPRTRLICLENTHNRCYGAPLGVEYTRQVLAIAEEFNLKTHLDGARIFNAAVALNTNTKNLADGFDSVSFCLSKGLCAPIGSLICGKEDFTDEARRVRKALGGGMRQVGIIAAAGIVAMDNMIERLPEDHENAKYLAQELAGLAEICIDVDRVRTNIIYFDLIDDSIDANSLLEMLDDEGIKIGKTGARTFRMVTHYGIIRSQIEQVIMAFKNIFH